MKPLSFLQIILGVFQILSAVTVEACNLPFEPSLESAQVKAQRRQCPVLLLFTGLDWSPRSIALDKRLLEHAVIEGLIEKSFVPVLVDFPQRLKLSAEQQQVNLALAERFKVKHFPTLIALGADGQELNRLNYEEETVPSLSAILESWARESPMRSTLPAK